ncbi:MAG: PAS domain-containing protein [Deltaproteobacteria bacterium]|nr:PAS domain-containing protein [Deltaproteobacteria bacterium]
MGSSFTEVVLNGEQRLLERILADAEANGHFGSAPPDPEEWRPTVRGISGSIVQAFRCSEEPSSLSQEELGKDNGLTAFMVVEARKRRLAGMTLGSFLALAKLIRRAYVDGIRSSGFLPNDEGRYRLFIERFFDRNEVAVCVSWATESNREQEETLTGMRDELSRVHALVAAAKEELEGTIDCLDAMILLADANGRILRCNSAFRQFAGKAYDEIVGRPFLQALEEVGMPAVHAGSQAVEHFHERLGRWFVLRLYPFREEPGEEPSGTIVTIRDATEVRNAAEELERGTSQLKDALAGLQRTQAKLLEQEKLAAAGRMAAGLAKEIDRPIGVVVGNLATLGKQLPRLMEAARRKREEPDLDYIFEDLRNLVGETREEADRVRAIAGDLKYFTRAEETEFRFADLNECLRDAFHAVRDEFKGRATLDRGLGDLPPTRCLPGRMTRVFSDILTDAARAARAPGVVRVRSWLADGFICVSVGDAGREMPQESLERVFEPFSRAGENGREEGPGLGLSVASDIVRKHGGDIRVRSGPGKGTTFIATIPLVKGG